MKGHQCIVKMVYPSLYIVVYPAPFSLQIYQVMYNDVHMYIYIYLYSYHIWYVPIISRDIFQGYVGWKPPNKPMDIGSMAEFFWGDSKPEHPDNIPQIRGNKNAPWLKTWRLLLVPTSKNFTPDSEKQNNSEYPCRCTKYTLYIHTFTYMYIYI